MQMKELILVEYDEGERRLKLMFQDCVLPQPRQTANSRFRPQGDSKGEQIRRYNEKQAELKKILVLALKQAGIKGLLFEKGEAVGFASSFWTKRADRADLSNFEKSAEDFCNGVVYHDDVQIFKRGEGEKIKDEKENMLIQVWAVRPD